MSITVLALFVVLLFSGPAGAIVNPHYQENCPSCHLKLPDKGADGITDYNFLAEDIDPTCLICHMNSCCTIAKPHESTHASGIDRWDKKKYGMPKKLPLSNGYITCATCHFWRRSNNSAPFQTPHYKWKSPCFIPPLTKPKIQMPIICSITTTPSMM